MVVISIQEEGRERIMFCETISIHLLLNLPTVFKMRRRAVSRSRPIRVDSSLRC
jgi:hypothetical protein